MASNSGVDPAAIDLPVTHSVDITSWCAEQLARGSSN
jgi:hypothetical protein